MDREFVRLPEFEKQCKHIALMEDDVKEIESILLADPSIGGVMQGTGGIRKISFCFAESRKKWRSKSNIH